MDDNNNDKIFIQHFSNQGYKVFHKTGKENNRDKETADKTMKIKNTQIKKHR